MVNDDIYTQHTIRIQRMNHYSISFAIGKYTLKIMGGVTGHQAKWFRQLKISRWEANLVKMVDGKWMVPLWNYLKGSISIHPLFNWIRHDWICFYVIPVLPFSINCEQISSQACTLFEKYYTIHSTLTV